MWWLKAFSGPCYCIMVHRDTFSTGSISLLALIL
uniref:Uncharacterized protein n=1 Tax=Anguilla anguilla TaxID=7936 RepID=A0A0E9THW1_ANGAN